MGNENNGGEKRLSRGVMIVHGLSNGGGFMLIQATVASYISVYMTDTVGIAAGTASIIMLIATLWDAVNDPIMGGICDRTKTKWGRYRPYILVVPFILTVVSFLLFLNPQGLSDGAKVGYFTVFYILYGMCVTGLTMPQLSLIPAMTKDDGERGFMVQFDIIMIAVAFTIASTFTTNLVNFFGSYAPFILIYGVLAIIANFILFKTSEEKYVVETEEKRPITKDLAIIIGHHPKLITLLIVWCLASIGYGIMFSSSVYYVMYYLMRPDLISIYMLIISIGALISMMVFMPFFLKIFKGNAVTTMIVTQALCGVCYVILFFGGNKSLPLLYIVSFLATCFGAMEQGLINFFVNDTIDYIQLKEGLSMNGIISAIKGFAYKMGSTATSSGILAILAATGYVAGAVGGQNAATMAAMNWLRFGIPAICCALIIIFLLMYPIKPYWGEIAKMKEGMKAKDEQ
ncbi:MAG: MFS transporter [Clostridiales bacterium]|nr:MFS transporter [Clostridiales bacterium]